MSDPCPIERTLSDHDCRLRLLEDHHRREELERARDPVTPAELKFAYQIAKWVVMTVAVVVITSLAAGIIAITKLMH